MLLVLTISSCSNPSDKGLANNDRDTIDGHPAWILNSNIYEVNIRQYTAEGTFNAFAKHLDRLKDMGVNTLWFMPINPISKVDRKGTLAVIMRYQVIPILILSMVILQNGMR